MKTCNQCGKCCIKYSDGGLSASPSELDWWEGNRPEIFRYVSNGNIWMNPDTGEPLSRCPWLGFDSSKGRYNCEIYHDRPEDCRHYPTHIAEMITDGCEMLESNDLRDKNNAQKKLDIIMSDTRPTLRSG
ncbi:YkgJ family cysteine cluster protein [Gammaproteobacteria bacterium]|nr:YkgJ family cysteine cluster protein [Gammaproteobacteria bacterium]